MPDEKERILLVSWKGGEKGGTALRLVAWAVGPWWTGLDGGRNSVDRAQQVSVAAADLS